MKLIWLSVAWEDYLYWQNSDKKKLRKINQIIKDIQRSPYNSIGSPEPLRHKLSGWWSRRIDLENRLVYRVEKNSLILLQCRRHY